MSLPSAVLYYDFSSIESGTTIPDLSGNNLNGTIEGGCSIENDPKFGKCLSFDGQTGYVNIPAMPADGAGDFTQGFTVCAMVNFSTFNQWSTILNIGEAFTGQATNNILIQNEQGSGKIAFNSIIENNPGNQFYTDIALTENTWNHVAGVIDKAGNATIYINGQVHGSIPSPDPQLVPTSNFEATSNFLGKCNWPANTWQYFKGKMAHVSVYNQALSATEINSLIANVELKRGLSFREINPIGFSVYTKSSHDYQPVIFIEQLGGGKSLHLNVINQSIKNLTIPKGTGSAANDNYHFQLRFRPGILAKSFIKQTKLSIGKNWNASVSTNNATGEVGIYLLNTGDPIALAPGDSQLFSIPNVNADPIGGARSTNVELLFGNLTLGMNNAPIRGSLLQNLSIVNHIGQKDIPMDLEILGSNRVLNEGGASNNLYFSLANTGIHPLSFSNETAQQTTIEVSIPIQQAGTAVATALVDSGDIASLSLLWDMLGIVETCTLGYRLDFGVPIGQEIANGQTASFDFDAGVSLGIMAMKDALPTDTVAYFASLGSIAPSSNQTVVLNQGKPNSKTLTIQESTQLTLLTLREGLTKPLKANQVLKSSPAPTESVNLIVQYDAPVGSSWVALVDNVKVPEGSKISLENDSDWKDETQSENEFLSESFWQKAFACQELIQLAPNDRITFGLEGIVSNLPNGMSYVLVNYYNVPGYWDGQLRIPIVKSPLDINASGNVGIGAMATAGDKLTVDGNLVVNGPINSQLTGGKNYGIAIGEPPTGDRKSALYIDVAENTTSLLSSPNFEISQDEKSCASLNMPSGRIYMTGYNPYDNCYISLPYPGTYEKETYKNNGIVIGDSNRAGKGPGAIPNSAALNIFAPDSGNVDPIQVHNYDNLDNYQCLFKMDWGGAVTMSYKLSVGGTVTAGGQQLSSDRRIKENISPLNPHVALANICNLTPSQYELKKEEEKNKGKVHRGFIAQEVKEVLPNSVEVADDGNLEDMHYLNYNAILTEAVSAIQALTKKVQDVEKENKMLKDMLGSETAKIREELTALKNLNQTVSQL